jgi:hypothetical protein
MSERKIILYEDDSLIPDNVRDGERLPVYRGSGQFDRVLMGYAVVRIDGDDTEGRAMVFTEGFVRQ